MIEICEPRLRAVSKYFSVRRGKRARHENDTRARWKARDGRGARTWTPFTKSEEKERLLTVYEQIVEGFKVQLFQILLFQLIFTADLIITNLLIYTEGNIYLNARTKFLLNNRVNRQELPPR